MALVGFLEFVWKCIHLLAWPSFALGYPLCASIRAIETNSDYHMRKLVAYWILFSLISLIEYTFSKLLEWVPVWPYVKILAICWFVIPHFNGASIAYNRLVRPCLFMQLPQIVVDLLNKKQDLSLKSEPFLVTAERYVNENGTEALEKLIAGKPKINEPTVAQKDMKAVEILDESTAAAENKTTTNPDAEIKVKNMTLPAKLTENVFPVPQAFKNVQKEWTCAVCQVTTPSEGTLNSHLQGMKHRTKCEELKAGKQTTKKGVCTGGPNKEWNCPICQVTTQNEATWNSHLQGMKHKSKCEEFIGVQTAKKNDFSSTTTKSDQANQDPNKSASGSKPNNKSKCEEFIGVQTSKKNNSSSTTTKSDQANQDPNKSASGSKPNNRSKCEEFIGVQTAKKNNSSSTTTKSDQANQDPNKSASGSKPNNKFDCANQDPKKSSSGGGPNNRFACDICQMTVQSEVTLKSHLQGAKHKSKYDQLKAREMVEKDKITSSAKDSDKDHQGYKKTNTGGALKQNFSTITEVKIEADVSSGYHSCTICNVKCTSESDMAHHLRGKRHLSQIEDSVHSSKVHYWCNICDVKCKNEIDMASHLNGTKHESNLYDSD